MSKSLLYKKVIREGIKYSINDEEKTAIVIDYQSYATEIIIPRSIKHESKEYIVKSISSRAFSGSDIRYVTFEPNSELQTIEKYAFSRSILASIQIPSHVTQICEGAFDRCEQLSRVEFEPNSELRTIEGYAFSNSNMCDMPIKIPRNITFDNKKFWDYFF